MAEEKETEKESMKEIRSEIGSRMKEFERTKAKESAEDLISEDKELISDVIKVNRELKTDFEKLLNAYDREKSDNDKFRKYLTSIRKEQVFKEYREDLKKKGIVRD